MTPEEAAARQQRAAAHLLDLARHGQRVLHVSANRREAYEAFRAIARLADDVGSDHLYRANGSEAYRHRPTGGLVRFAALDSADHRGVSVDLVAIAPDVDLAATTLDELAAAVATNPAGHLRTVGHL